MLLCYLLYLVYRHLHTYLRTALIAAGRYDLVELTHRLDADSDSPGDVAADTAAGSTLSSILGQL